MTVIPGDHLQVRHSLSISSGDDVTVIKLSTTAIIDCFVSEALLSDAETDPCYYAFQKLRKYQILNAPLVPDVFAKCGAR